MYNVPKSESANFGPRNIHVNRNVRWNEIRFGINKKDRICKWSSGVVQIVLNDLKFFTGRAKNAVLMVMIQLESETPAEWTSGDS